MSKTTYRIGRNNRHISVNINISEKESEHGRANFLLRMIKGLSSANWISIIALTVSIYSMTVSQRQYREVSDRAIRNERRSVRPLLAYNSSILSSADTLLLSIGLTNEGIGPAILKEMRVFYNNIPISSWNKIDSIITKEWSGLQSMNITYYCNDIPRETPFRPGNRVDLFSMQVKKHTRVPTRFINIVSDKISFYVVYSSLLDEVDTLKYNCSKSTLK